MNSTGFFAFFERFGAKIGYTLLLVVISSFFFIHTGHAIDAGKNRYILYAFYIVSFGITLALIFLKKSDVLIMAILLVLSGTALAIFLPAGYGPDEDGQFYRAYEVSTGGLTSVHLTAENPIGGNFFPGELRNYKTQNDRLNPDNIEVFVFGNLALYSPVGYLPQALGIAVTRLFAPMAQTLYFAGRFAGMVFCLALCILALYLMPFGKEILFLLMITPMPLQQMCCSISPDGMTIALAFLLFAYSLHLAERKAIVSKTDIAVLFCLCIFLSQMKIVYIICVFFILLIPAKKFGSKETALKLTAAMIGVSILCNLIWLKISWSYLVEFNPGVDTNAQVKYILTHAFRYYATVVNTSAESVSPWIQYSIGYALGSGNVGISVIVWIFFLFLILGSVFLCRDAARISTRNLVTLFCIFLIGSALIVTSIYVQWTAVKAALIDGVQGRYFIPILPALLFSVAALANRDITSTKKAPAKPHRFLYFVVLTLEGITLTDVLNHCITDSVASLIFMP